MACNALRGFLVETRIAHAPADPYHTGGYLPFGAGPRICIGQHLTIQEGLLLMPILGQRYRLRLVPGYPVVPHSTITLSPQFGIQMQLERRT